MRAKPSALNKPEAQARDLHRTHHAPRDEPKPRKRFHTNPKRKRAISVVGTLRAPQRLVMRAKPSALNKPESQARDLHRTHHAPRDEPKPRKRLHTTPKRKRAISVVGTLRVP